MASRLAGRFLLHCSMISLEFIGTLRSLKQLPHFWLSTNGSFYLASHETEDRECFLVVKAFGPFLLDLAVGEYFSPKAGERCMWISGPAKHRGLGLTSRAPCSHAAGEVWKRASSSSLSHRDLCSETCVSSLEGHARQRLC